MNGDSIYETSEDKLEDKQQTMVKVPEKVLLSLVAAKLKGRIFFPEQVERARKFLENVKTISF